MVHNLVEQTCGGLDGRASTLITVPVELIRHLDLPDYHNEIGYDSATNTLRLSKVLETLLKIYTILIHADCAYQII